MPGDGVCVGRSQEKRVEVIRTVNRHNIREALFPIISQGRKYTSGITKLIKV